MCGLNIETVSNYYDQSDRRTNTFDVVPLSIFIGANQAFLRLEVIKERMVTFFDQPTEAEAKEVFEELGAWIWQAQFKPLMKWYDNFEKGWDTAVNYFRFKVTSALSEGHNNVIKMLKRRAFGYRNMEYFRLKIMQVCGYLNSRFIPNVNSLTCT